MASSSWDWSTDRIICRGVGLGAGWGAVIGAMTVLVYLPVWGHIEIEQAGVFIFVVCGCAAIIGALVGVICGISGTVAIALVLGARPSPDAADGTGGPSGGQLADTRSWRARVVVIRALAAAGAAVPPAMCALVTTSAGATTFVLAVAAEAGVAGAVLGPRAARGGRGGTGTGPGPGGAGAPPLHSAE